MVRFTFLESNKLELCCTRFLSGFHAVHFKLSKDGMKIRHWALCVIFFCSLVFPNLMPLELIEISLVAT